MEAIQINHCNFRAKYVYKKIWSAQFCTIEETNKFTKDNTVIVQIYRKQYCYLAIYFPYILLILLYE